MINLDLGQKMVGLVLVGLLGLGAILLIKKENVEPNLENKSVEGSSTMNSNQVRSPQFAGQFYSGQRAKLSKDLERYFETAQEKTPRNLPQKSVKALIVPHAGYPYSGSVAAVGFNQLEPEAINRVILIGSSHQKELEQATISGEDKWESPLGQVSIDTAVRDKLSQSKNFVIDSQVHQKEHSLEVQLPFLQKRLNQFELVPILVGGLDDQKITGIKDQLLPVIDEQTLVVISTDLSHYPSYELANQADRETIEAIMVGDVEEFKQVVGEIKPTQALQTRACGHQAVELLLRMSKSWQELDIELLHYANSGDASGDLSRVVGYAAMAVYGHTKDGVDSQKEDSSDELDKDQTLSSRLTNIARETLEQVIVKGEEPALIETDDPDLLAHKGVFVTLKKQGKLRGCMGLIESDQSLWESIQEMAQAAALKDPRFPVVKKSELPEIEIEVSVLSVPETIQDPQQVEVGQHGVIMEQGQRRGVFLSQVATEQGYNRDQFLSALCTHKMNLKADCWQDPQTKIKVFTASVYNES